MGGMLNGIRIYLDGTGYDFDKSKLQALFLLALERVGGSVQTLSEHLGVTTASVSHWRLGKRRLVGDNLARLVRLAMKGL